MDNSLRMLLNGGEKKMSEWMLVWLNRVMRQCRTSNSRRSRSVFLFLMGRICWCRTHRGGCRGFVSYSSFDHQLQPTLRHGKYEIRNTTTKFNQKNSSATPLAGGSEKLSKFIIRLELFPFSHVIHPLRLLASNLTDTPFLLFLLLLLPFLLQDLRIHHINPHSQYPYPPTLDGTGNTLPTFEHIYETFEILKVKEEKKKLL